MGTPTVLADARAAAWVLRRVRRTQGRATTVDQVVPDGFARYAVLPGEAEGTLTPEELAVLCDALAGHTATPGDCVLALPTTWPAGAEAAPAGEELSLAGRSVVLVAAALDDVVSLSYDDRPGRWWAQSPVVLWPQDRAWCVATPPRQRVTVVGGSVALVEDLVASSGLDARPAGPGDRLVG
ncbi:hypothetical protein Q6346_08290 [Isoptericola sp. b490]|uniref:hypothetical protein n=1 Tax=Actinotalea lenta TaxID=3064654 RepID=UPI002712569B|nr:hypothetical protein [Isoptericola sp. b490]MDO8121310.1 hypothetical protein [Isoptericola sp. b490]